MDWHSDKLFARSDSFVTCVCKAGPITQLHPQAPAVVGANNSS